MLKSKIQCEKCGLKKIVNSEDKPHKSKLKCPSCSNEFIYEKNIFFDNNSTPDFNPKDYMHPFDSSALYKLKKIPGLQLITSKVMEYSYEKIVRVNNLSDNIRVSDKTCKYINDMVINSARILHVQPPKLYLNQNPTPNAYTTCVNEPIIVISSGLIELCDDDELYAVIAHEMGHIKCEHVLYHMIADLVCNFPSLFGTTEFITFGLKFALLEWSRKSELTADRFAYIVTKDKEKIISLLMKLAGGSSKLMSMISYDEFLDQHKDWSSLMENFTDKMIERAFTITRTHPLPIIRAYEFEKWVGDINKNILISQQ
jgi:Zn-dependent protease with chaperone function